VAEMEADAGASSGEVDDSAITAAIRTKTDVGIDRRQAVAEVAVELRVPRRRVYALAVALRDTPQ